MAVQVHEEPLSMRCWPQENCCLCRKPTRWWHGTGALNVALCPACAARSEPSDVPSKQQWMQSERQRAGEVRPWRQGLAP